MIGIIGKKLGMTQIFNERGSRSRARSSRRSRTRCSRSRTRRRPASRPCSSATARSALRASRRRASGRRAAVARRGAEVGHAKKAGLDAPPRVLRSVRLDEPGNAKAEIPTLQRRRHGQRRHLRGRRTVKVTGTSKGRGFQGVVKRYGFGGGPNTHGNTKHRRPGSIGPGTDPSRVIKGKKMPGHYGDERHTQTHLRVEKIDAERNLIYIRGVGRRPDERDRRSSASRAKPMADNTTTFAGGRVHGAGHGARAASRCPSDCSTAP